jgi:rhodanese-related sulfurtransferase
MFQKLLKLSLILLVVISVSNAQDLKNKGVSITYLDFNEDKKQTVIKRVHDDECLNVKVSPNNIWSGNYTSKNIPSKCKKTFATSIGKLSPIKIDKDIETYGELEVIEFIRKAQDDENMVLIDARMLDWYLLSTIPGSINIPFKHFNSKKSPDEFEDVLDVIGVSIENGKYNFKNAKTLTLFCNGAWCLQSPAAIKNLIKIGYPKEKLFWYRGGMYNWTLAGLTTIVP